MRRRLRIVLAVGAAVVILAAAAFMLAPRPSPTPSVVTAPPVTDAAGAHFVVQQGTTATIGSNPLVRLGLVAVRDGKATVSLHAGTGEGETANAVLGPGEHLDFQGYRVSVVKVTDLPDLPTLATGSGGDSVELLVTEAR